MKKKGLSPVIATVLIVLLTISAGAILSQILIPFVRDNLSDSTSCLPYQDYFQFEEIAGSNCILDGNALISVRAKSVEKNSGNTKDQLNESILGFELLVGKESVTKKFTVPSDQVRMYDYSSPVTIPGPGGLRTYNLSLGEQFEYAEVYIRLKNGDLCPKSDTINLKQCAR